MQKGGLLRPEGTEPMRRSRTAMGDRGTTYATRDNARTRFGFGSHQEDVARCMHGR